MPIYKTPVDNLVIYDNDVRKMYQLCDGLEERALLSTIWLTGARIGEVLRIKKCDIKTKDNRLIIELFTEKIGRKKTKDKDKPKEAFMLRNRVLSFKIRDDINESLYITTLIKHLEAFKGGWEDLLFPTHRKTVQRWINRISKEAIGKELAVHTFRHSVLTHLGSSGKIGMKELATFKGSENPGSVAVYIRKRAFELDYGAINRDKYSNDDFYENAVRFIQEENEQKEPEPPKPQIEELQVKQESQIQPQKIELKPPDSAINSIIADPEQPKQTDKPDIPLISIIKKLEVKSDEQGTETAGSGQADKTTDTTKTMD